MKRSEMISQLQHVLYQFMPSVEPRKIRLIADVVLTEAEREGMAPPLTTVEFSTYYPDSELTDTVQFKARQWAPE